MIVGPNPALPIAEADRIGRLLYRHLRDSAGDRAAEVRSAGGGRVRLPADLFRAAADDVPEALTADDVLVVVALAPGEDVVLTGEELTPDDGLIVAPVSPSAEPPSGPAPVVDVDPSDRSIFPNLSALHRFADDHGIDLTGVSKRDDVEAVIRRSLSRNTTTPA